MLNGEIKTFFAPSSSLKAAKDRKAKLLELSTVLASCTVKSLMSGSLVTVSFSQADMPIILSNPITVDVSRCTFIRRSFIISDQAKHFTGMATNPFLNDPYQV